MTFDRGFTDFKQNLDINNLPSDFRLFYTFHKKEYLGGAHGLFGVLYEIFKAFDLNYDYFSKLKNVMNYNFY